MVKRCLECNAPVVMPGLQVAMEQREHFAMTRHAETCNACALKMLDYFERAASGSRFWRQCVDCVYCGHKLPIVRLRFQVKDHAHRHLAVCENCYDAMRDQLVRGFPNLVMFVEQEWQTRGMKSQSRVPHALGVTVRIRDHPGNRYSGMTGKVVAFRCLVQPWFGYEVGFPDGKRHFFHERDLYVVGPGADSSGRMKAASETRSAGH